MSHIQDTDMSPTRLSTRNLPAKEIIPRRKACSECSKTKVRCDQKRPFCSRCVRRRTNCIYAGPTAGSEERTLQPGNNRASSTIPAAAVSTNSPLTLSNISTFTSSTASPGNTAIRKEVIGDHTSPDLGLDYVISRVSNPYWNGSALCFKNLQLVCNLDTTRIRDRWLSDFVPTLNDRAKAHPPEINRFVTRVLGTYPKMLLRKGNLPPYIHPAQLEGVNMPTPLANCLSLVKLWDGRVRGGELIVNETIKNEMERLYNERQDYTPMDLLAAFQAYLNYAMMVFFSTDGDTFINRQVLINLQDFGCELAAGGLVCPEELSHTRPRWESWIVCSAKRRCLYTMYLFDNIFCAKHGIPTFIGEELESLPVPAPKVLWECTSRDIWEKEYNDFLSLWEGSGLHIDELWPVPESGREARRKRVDKWLGSVDEFGMMLFAVTSVTHGA